MANSHVYEDELTEFVSTITLGVVLVFFPLTVVGSTGFAKILESKLFAVPLTEDDVSENKCLMGFPSVSFMVKIFSPFAPVEVVNNPGSELTNLLNLDAFGSVLDKTFGKTVIIQTMS